MKIIYNILIIGTLCISKTWSQDSLKNKSSKIEVERNESIHNLIELRGSVENSRQRVEDLRDELRATAKSRSYSLPMPPIPPVPPMPPLNFQDSDVNDNSEDNPFEKKKTITKTFSVDSKDRLNISNQHGDVKIELWDKNEIKVDITIIGYGTTEAKAQQFIDNVEITDKREGDKISFKTFIDSDNSNWNWGNNWSYWRRFRLGALRCG